MKNVFVYSSLITVLANVLIFTSSCQQTKPSPQTQSPVVLISATEELGKWLDTFNENPVLSELMDSIKAQYPEMMSDIRFLDSIRGLKIDFIGMIHSDFQHPDSVIAQCHVRVAAAVQSKDYLFIGTEMSSVHGKVDLNAFLADQCFGTKQCLKFLYGQNHEFSMEEARKSFRRHIPYDYVIQKLYSGNAKPYIIGTDPQWVWLAEQMLRELNLQSFSPELREKISQLIPLLNHCRSEIALVRTARELIRSGKNKTAVLIYGKNHLDDFHYLAERFGTVSQFILPKDCDSSTN